MFATTASAALSPIRVKVRPPEVTIPPREIITAQDFKELVRCSELMVDKSLFINKILCESSKIILITYPRLWGKTINLHMLKDFVELVVHKNGTIPHHEETCNYKLFKNGEICTNVLKIEQKLQSPFAISQHEHLFKTHQGQYPVIFVDLGNFQEEREEPYSYEEIFDNIYKGIRQAYKEHDYIVNIIKKILQDNTTEPVQKATAQAHLDTFTSIVNQRANETVMANSLLSLSAILHNHLNKRVFLLIDGYDAVLNQTLLIENASVTDEKKLLNFYKTLFQITFDDNDHIEKAILTGVLQIAKAEFNFTSIKEYNFLHSQIQRFYGFSTYEVDQLFKEAGTFAAICKTAKEAYGYEFGPETKMYNPWTIAQVIQWRNVIHSFWTQAIRTKFLQYQISASKLFYIAYMEMAKNESYPIYYDNLQFNRIMLKQMIHDFNHNLTTPKTINTVLNYLVATGYLTLRYKQKTNAIVNCANGETRNELAINMLRHVERVNKAPIPLRVVIDGEESR